MWARLLLPVIMSPNPIFNASLINQECVAEYTRRPLLPLTSGDIGTDPVTVDRTLAKYFKLGESWGAIVLLDEADVYLEARNLHDLARNSLVSGNAPESSS